MKKEELFEAMADIDDAYILDATNGKKTKKRRVVSLVAAAACVVIIVGGFFGIRAFKAEHRWPVKYVVSEETDNEEIDVIPRWEDMQVWQRYSEIEFQENRYTGAGGKIAEDRLGDSLGTVTAKGWDEYAGMEGLDGERCLAAQVYSITGISSECAVAVRYEGEDGLFVFINSWYRPETLGQFMTDLNMEEEVIFNCVYYDWKKPSGDSALVRFDNIDSSKVHELLLSHAEAVNEYDELAFEEPKKILGISVDVPLAGQKNVSLSVCEGGYIKTNILNTGKLFYIGEEYTEKFVRYVLEDCEGYQVVMVLNSEPMPE